ncbi:hypothetical protein Fmac_007819 [Flemingia macrophylla]|uniref:Uncharacterized protein n=1 Tax=Flemingia macrophylla TaxID=520843 RepID=A0ABD1MVR5_9FABA
MEKNVLHGFSKTKAITTPRSKLHPYLHAIVISGNTTPQHLPVKAGPCGGNPVVPNMLALGRPEPIQ